LPKDSTTCIQMASFTQISSKIICCSLFTSIRPSNVLLNEYSNLKLCDFGLAKKIVDLVQGSSGGSTAAEAESNKPKSGTPYYMAPELF